jgi:SAM-dependent methyltransferase
MGKTLFKKIRKPLFDERLARFEHWFESLAGQKILPIQQSMVDDVLAHSFGYHLLQLSVSRSAELYTECRVQRQFRCHPLPIPIVPTPSSEIAMPMCQAVMCDFEQLPFEGDSLDVVVLHHVHELVDNPHQLLREIHRVVVANGRLIIMGVNPWSLRGLYARVMRYRSPAVWHNQIISCRRMDDWLGLLGFKVSKVEYGFKSPKVLSQSTNGLIKRLLAAWPFGGIYMMSAVKQQAGMTFVRPVWSPVSKSFAGLTPIKTSSAHTVVSQLKLINKRNIENKNKDRN